MEAPLPTRYTASQVERRHDVGPPGDSEPVIISASRIMQEVRELASRAGATDAKVLITGESGVGKDLLARFIHARSARVTRPLVAVNCAAFSETLLESELFGHVKGSFTGAYRDKLGKLQLARGGTIFLDEIGEMSPRMQALLLRFLESGEIQPVGSESIGTTVDVRVFAATNRDLDTLVAAGKFREDLLYRIKVVHIHVPPLRERPEDVVAMAEYLLAKLGATLTFSPEATQALEQYRWPGNVRELRNVVEQLIWMSSKPMVDAEDLPAPIRPVGTTAPTRERRHQIADDLYAGLINGRYTFWNDVHQLFLARDITRRDLRTLICRGLKASNGNYRAMLRLFGMAEQDYKRLLNFLTAHGCAVNFREFRGAQAEPSSEAAPVAADSVEPTSDPPRVERERQFVPPSPSFSLPRVCPT